MENDRIPRTGKRLEHLHPRRRKREQGGTSKRKTEDHFSAPEKELLPVTLGIKTTTRRGWDPIQRGDFPTSKSKKEKDHRGIRKETDLMNRKEQKGDHVLEGEEERNSLSISQKIDVVFSRPNEEERQSQFHIESSGRRGNADKIELRNERPVLSKGDRKEFSSAW